MRFRDILHARRWPETTVHGIRNNRMKILLLTYEYPPFRGGVATYLSNLMNAAPAGVEVVIDVPKEGEHWIMTAWRQYFKVRKVRPDLIAISHVLPVGYVAFKIIFGSRRRTLSSPTAPIF